MWANVQTDGQTDRGTSPTTAPEVRAPRPHPWLTAASRGLGAGQVWAHGADLLGRPTARC